MGSLIETDCSDAYIWEEWQKKSSKEWKKKNNFSDVKWGEARGGV